MKAVFTSIVLVVAGLVFISCVRHEFDDANLREYAKTGDTNSLSRYLLTTTNVNHLIRYGFREKDSATLIQFAVGDGQLEAVKLLLAARADPNQKDPYGQSSLMWVVACTKSEVNQPTRNQIMLTLLKKGADPNLKDNDGIPPLILASVLRNTELVKELLNGGAAINITDGDGNTALHSAGNAEVARLLLSAGADINLKNLRGDTPIDVAIQRKQLDVVALLKGISPKQ